MKNLKGKVAIITGASSGIGLALSKTLAQEGIKVVMAARTIDKLHAQEAEIIKNGGEAFAVACDVTKSEDCRLMVEQAVDKFGRIDICICNAGISMRALFDDVDLDVIHKLMDVNFWGAVNCVKYALPYIQHAKGSIVGVSSVAGIHGLPARTGYSASKYALKGFLETIRVENLKKDVHVMLAYPGFTASNVRFSALTADGSQQGETPRDEGKMMSAEQVSILILKGIKNRKRDLIMDFQGRASNFIKKFAPALLDKLFYNHMAKEPNSPLK